MLFRSVNRTGLRLCLSVLSSLAWVALPTSAQATYSILVADRGSGQTGVAVASCVGSYDLRQLLRVVPGLGAIQVQAHTGFYGQTKLFDLLAQGVAPAQALALVTDPKFDPRQALRQYAIVDFWGRTAAFTGQGDGAWAGDRQGALDGLHYSAQGNLLSDGDVLLSLEAGLRRQDACDLAERLVFSLEAVAATLGHGDARCTPRGISADSGYLRVAGVDGSTLVELDVQATGNTEPAVFLRSAYEAFRAEHACGSLPSQPINCPKAASGSMSLSARAAPTHAGLFALAALSLVFLFFARRGRDPRSSRISG
jgi:uncharacterized Ntn-hydrolase superfamily protein